jgi:hypothetical protein
LVLAIAETTWGVEIHHGLNLPPTQGTSNAGAFQQGVYRFDYSPELLRRITDSGFTHLRVPVNVATANDIGAMRKVASLFAITRYRGIVCMFDTNEGDETGHGNGKPNDLNGMAAAWHNIHSGFHGKPGFNATPHIMYELFNEPFGYAKNEEGRAIYLKDMRTLIKRAGLPVKRCVIDGMGYADDIQSVANSGWRGALGYHFYPNWLPSGKASTEGFSKLIVDQCSGIRNDVFITEFGTRLDFDEAGKSPATEPFHDHQALDGLQKALNALKTSGHRISGTYHWHGWDNGDSYSFWNQTNRLGAIKVRELQSSN